MQQAPDYAQLMKLAQSPAGQQLIAMLQHSGGDALQSAMNKASAGDYSQAKKLVSSLLTDPKAKALLKQLEEQA